MIDRGAQAPPNGGVLLWERLMLRKLLIALGVVILLAILSVLAIQIPQRLG
tara:strand:- start:74 stop:226 length:153 start_codon:yes stop_codon:yes gene_type:complete